MEVFQILTSMNAGYELLVAGLLHDTVEDTDVTIDDIRKAFGERVATLVGNHSEDKSKTWKERKQHTIDELKTADRDTKDVYKRQVKGWFDGVDWVYVNLSSKVYAPGRCV